MGRGRKRQPAMPAVAAAGDADRTATPQNVLEALHRAAAMSRTRIPIVTAEIATPAQSFGMLPDIKRDLELGFRALRGLSEATEAGGAYLAMLADVVKQVPAV